MDRPADGASLVNRWFGQFDYRSNETRFLVLEYILAHPNKLPSFDELATMIPNTTTEEVKTELSNLLETGLLSQYDPPANHIPKNGPSRFYGLTAAGVKHLKKSKFLKITPVATKIYSNMTKPPRVEHCESIPRPSLPDEITAEFEQVTAG